MKGRRNRDFSSHGQNGLDLGQWGDGSCARAMVTRDTTGVLVRRSEERKTVNKLGKVFVFLFLVIPFASIAGFGLAKLIHHGTAKSNADHDSETEDRWYPPVNMDRPEKLKGGEFYADFLLKEHWNDRMSSTDSPAFRSLAKRLQPLIDEIYRFSPLRSLFNHSTVIQLSKHEEKLIQVTSLLKLRDRIRTQDQPDLKAVDLKVSFLQGHRSLLSSRSIGNLQKDFAVKIITSNLTVTSPTTTTTTTTLTTTVRPTRMTTKSIPAWMTTKSTQFPAWMITQTTPASATRRPYATVRPQEVPCGEVRVLPDLRIVGGSDVNKGVYPWMVMLLRNTLFEKQKFFCGGSILDRWNIITAAHCLRGEPKNRLTGVVDTQTHQITVVAGKHWRHTSIRYSQEQRVLARAAYMHSSYTLFPIKHDIAVIRLSRPLQLNSRVTPLCLPAANDPLPPVCMVAGWGDLDQKKGDYPQALQSATLQAYNSSECRRIFGSTFRYKGHSMDYYLDPGTMCASNSTFGGQDTCKGDSGGPLFCLQTGASGERRYTQFGVVSWGVGCGEPGKPGFYAYLPHYISWVRSRALPHLDRYASSLPDKDEVCRTFSPTSDYRVRQCLLQLRRLQLDNMCSNLNGVVSCMMNELEDYGYFCQWQDVHDTIVRSLGQQQRQQCQAHRRELPDAICHNLTAVSSALSLCTQDIDCVSMLEVTLCVHSRLDSHWLQCTRQQLKEFLLTHLSDSFHICDDYTVRTMADGRQFMYMGGDWHVLCADHWGHHEAKVACTQRGFRGGKPSFLHRTNGSLHVSERGNTSIDVQSAVKASGWLKVTCSGYESSLSKCLVRETTCLSSYLAASVCFNTPDNFSLSPSSPGSHYGYIHLTRDEGEGYVCVPDLSDPVAHQLCREAGYVAGMVHSQSLAPPNSPAVWETDMLCGAGEVMVSGCAHGQWTLLQRASGSCTLAKVFCFAEKARLHNILSSTGIVQMYRPTSSGYDVTLKTVCRHGFGDISAGILCRQLGFSGVGRALPFNPFYRPNTDYVSVDCTGRARKLEECEVRDGVCTEPAVVQCGSQAQEAELSVRLSGPDSAVQVWMGGQWGTVCTDHWTHNEATAICRQLGHLHGYRRFPPFDANPRRDWPHVLHSLHCGVHATSLRQCSFQPVTSDLCQHVRAAAVLCSNESKPVYTIHSSNPSRPNEGEVHVNYKGATAPLRAYMSDATASGLCQAVGYVTGEKMRNRGFQSRRDSGHVWLMTLTSDCADADHCVHVHPELINCTGGNVTDYRCHRPVVFVHCYTSAARVHTGAGQTTGVVQLYRKGQWWEACHDDITQAAADVICHDIMGSPTASAIILRDVFRHRTFQRVRATTRYCNPRDPSMTSSNCLVLDLTSRCESSNSQPASVVCYDGPKPSGAISSWKLDGSLYHSRRVMVKRYGVWGTVCDDTWYSAGARLLCKHLGYTSGSMVYLPYKHDPAIPLWAWSVDCSISTSNIDNCDVNLTHVVTGSCRTERDAMVKCNRFWYIS